jgi:hypothetical protein
MKAKIWIGVILFIALVIVASATLVSCQDKSGKVQFSSECSDIIDPWTRMSQEEKIRACQELISSKTAELEKMGFEPQDCQVTKAEVKDCGIGTQLLCTYTCSDTAE